MGEKGYDRVYGARPLRRIIQSSLEDKLSEDLLRSKFRAGDTITVDLDGEELSIHAEPVAALAGDEKK